MLAQDVALFFYTTPKSWGGVARFLRALKLTLDLHFHQGLRAECERRPTAHNFVVEQSVCSKRVLRDRF